MAVRTEANAISTMTNWLSNFLVVQVLPTMTASINEYTFLLFALANMIFLPIIYIYYPETSGRTLEELDVSPYLCLDFSWLGSLLITFRFSSPMPTF
jgi:hypothetical protein